MNTKVEDNYLKKELYELIKSDESIFDFIQESALDGLWYWDIEKPENEWMNARFWKVLGYNPADMPHKSSAWQNIINRDDLTLALNNFTKHIENSNHPYDQIVRYTHKNGSIVWIRCRGMAVRDVNGKPIRMLGAHHDITELLQYEQKLKEKNEEFEAQNEEYKQINEELLFAKQKAEESVQLIRNITDTIPAYIAVVDINTLEYKFVNQKFLTSFNKSEEQIIGHHISDIIGKENAEFAMHYITEVRNGKSASYINTFTIAEGTRYINVNYVPGRNEKGELKDIIVLSSDVTDIKNSEIDLQNAKDKAEENETSLLKHNEMFLTLLENLTQGVFMVEAPSGKPILANEAAKIILGRGILPDANMTNLGEVYKAYKTDTMQPYPPEEMPIVQGMMGVTKYIDDMIIEQPNGKLVNLEIYGTPVSDSSGNVWASLVSFSDITERIKSQNELIKAKEKAEESDRLKSAFLQNMSHEIRTPMNAIMGFSDLLESNFDDKNKLKLFSNIIRQRSNDLLDIINDILDIAKIESGLVTVRYDECNITDIFAELATFFSENKKKLGKEHIMFSLHVLCEPDQCIVLTDKTKLKQILINLIGNAFKFTEQGKIEGICSIDKNNNLFFSVSDTGIGIPNNKQEMIFERFAQAHLGTKMNFGGTGLGLSIVKGLVTLFGGEVFIESEPKKGSTFSFTIPYKPTQLVPQKQVISTSINVNVLINKSILIVEDDANNADFLKEVLKNKGLKILHTEFGKEGIEIALSNKIDLVLMDIRLPDINGYEVTRQIRQHKPQLKIIAQTAYASHEEKQKALEAGCNDFISKPTKPDLLLEMICKHV